VQKILLIGLDGAGKTACYQKYFGKKSVEQLKKITPTRGIAKYDHDFLRSDVEIIDLGGGKKFRQGYVGNTELIQGVSAIIYFIDVQDPARYKEAADFLSLWTKSIASHLQNVKGYILFHKIDPGTEAKIKSDLEKIARMIAPLESYFEDGLIKTITTIYNDSPNQIFQRILLDTLSAMKKAPRKPSTTEPIMKPVQQPTAPLTKPPVQQPTTQEPFLTKPVRDKEAPPKKDKPLGIKPQPIIPKLAPKPKPKPTTPPTQKPPAISDKGKSTPPPPKVSSPSSLPPPPPPSTDKPSQFKPPTLSKSAPMQQAKANEIKEKTAERLTDLIEASLDNNVEFVAIAVFSERAELVVGAVKESANPEILQMIKETLLKINLEEYMSRLGKAKIGGEGHLKIADYDIFFERVAPEHMSTVICSSIGEETIDNILQINRYLNQALSITPDGVDEKTFIRADLMSELKMKLYHRGKSVDHVG
jgi:GTPase SAR1 family protein